MTNYNKTLVDHSDWLSEIDGRTVAEAIAYLQTLDQTHRLDCYLEGDTHGCDVVSRLLYDVPMTDAEIYARLEGIYLKQIADLERGRQYYINRGQLDRVPNSDKLIAELRAKLAEAKAKYCKNTT